MQVETMRLELDLADRIEWLRRRRGLAAGELTARTGIPYQTMYAWRNRTRKIPAWALAPIARALETSTDFLTGMTDDPRPRPAVVGTESYPDDRGTPE
jgi:hypothetical protein